MLAPLPNHSRHAFAQGPQNARRAKLLVRKGGLEPPPLAGPDPKSGASANSATFALALSLVKSITYLLALVQISFCSSRVCPLGHEFLRSECMVGTLPKLRHAHFQRMPAAIEEYAVNSSLSDDQPGSHAGHDLEYGDAAAVVLQKFIDHKD